MILHTPHLTIALHVNTRATTNHTENKLNNDLFGLSTAFSFFVLERPKS